MIKRFKIFESELNKDINPYIATLNSITDYYYCNECNAMWRVLNQPKMEKCPYCKSKNIITIDSDDWFDKILDRSDDDEIIEIEKDRERSYSLIDLITYGKSNEIEKYNRIKRNNIN